MPILIILMSCNVSRNMENLNEEKILQMKKTDFENQYAQEAINYFERLKFSDTLLMITESQLKNEILAFSVIVKNKQKRVLYSLYHARYSDDYINVPDTFSLPKVNLMINKQNGLINRLDKSVIDTGEFIINYYVEKLSNSEIENIRSTIQRDTNYISTVFYSPNFYKNMILYANYKTIVNKSLDNKLETPNNNFLYREVWKLSETENSDYRGIYESSHTGLFFNSDTTLYSFGEMVNESKTMSNLIRIGLNIVQITKFKRIGNTSSTGVIIKYFERIDL